MPSIVLDGTGPSKSSLVEGGYDFCGLSGDQYERTPEEMSKGLRLLNDIMASLKSYDGIDLGFDFPAYGEGLLEEPSGISLAARRPVCALLAQTLAPTIGATLTPEANAVLSTAMQSLRAFSTVAPPSRVPSSRMRTLHRLRRICGCTSPSVVPTPTPVPVAPPVTTPVTPTGPTLSTLFLSAATFTENSAAGTVIGTVLGRTAGSTITLTNDAGGRVSYNATTNQLLVGSTNTDFEVNPTLSIQLTETLATATNSPLPTSITIGITNIFEQPNLGVLTFSATTFSPGILQDGTINGATTGSTITATGLPASITINSAARTFHYDGTGAPGTGSFTLTETLTDSSNSPRPSTVSYTISSSSVLDDSVGLPTLALANGVMTYPPQYNVGLPVGFQVGVHSFRFQSSGDYLFGSTSINDLLTPTDASASANSMVDSAVAGITSGINYARVRIEWVNAGVTHFSDWSNIQGHGDNVAPTITSSATLTTAELQPMAFPVTTSEPCTLAISGTDASLLQITPSGVATSFTVQLVGNANLNFEAKPSYSFTLTATDPSGNPSTPQACTQTVTDLDEVPTALSFSSQTNATLGQTYTSNTVTVAGLGTGVPANYSVAGGAVSKNGGTFGTAAGSVVNGDTLTLQGVAPGTDGLSTTVALTIGDPAATYTYKILTPGAGITPTMATPVPNGVSSAQSNRFTGLTFAAGVPLIELCSNAGATDIAIYNPSGGSLLETLTLVAHSSDNQYQCWTGTALASGTYDVLVNATNLGLIGIKPLSLAGANPTPTSSSSVVQGAAHTTPWQVPATLTANAGDVIISFFTGDLGTDGAGHPAQTFNGTQLSYTETAYFVGKHTASAQPGFTGSGSHAIGGIAAVFTPA